MPDAGFYALALDGHKDQVRTIASNPGHALGAGVVPPEHARAVADRLLEPDLFSGWGVRSLSTRHPSYDPFAYHLGAVWPVEQATFALGCKRYGLDDHVDLLVDGLFAVAQATPAGRLPEALSGFARDDIPIPVPYPAANIPQAWSASALVQLVQIMLGLYPFAPLRLLAVIRPRLPAWAPEVTLTGLRVGRAVVDLRFVRRSDGTAAWHVVRQRGSLLVVGAGPPDDRATGWIERLEATAIERSPGRLANALRIAFGRI
jgi:glycogen debranching enzyme